MYVRFTALGVCCFKYDAFAYPKTSFRKNLNKYEGSSKYEMMLQNKYKNELHADEVSSRRTSLTVKKCYMEEQLAKAYTVITLRKISG